MAWQSSTINPATTTPAADISKITNDLQQLRGVIGGAPDAAIPSVWTTPAAVLGQTANSGTTAGTSTAYTLTPGSAITAYTAGQTFWVTFHAASGASPTLQISGLASPPNLVKQDSTGAYVAIAAGDIPANHRSRVTLLSATQAFVEELPPVVVPLVGLKNRIMNGKMDISQRGTSFVSPANNTYTLDRFVWSNSSAAAVTITQQADAPSSNEFQNSLRVAITTADTSIAAGDNAGVMHPIEGFNVRDLIGRPFTLSFWVRSSKTGIHCVAFVNNGNDRSYVAEYTVNAANTWEFKTITVSGGLITAGTWNWTNGRGLQVWFTLASGSSTQTTAGAWQTGTFISTANQVNCLDTIGNIFAITGVQLEQSSTATPFDHRPYGAELALCLRYTWVFGYQNNAVFGTGWENVSAGNVSTITPVPMRAAPTLASSSAASTFSVQDSGSGGRAGTALSLTYATTNSITIGLAASGTTANAGCHVLTNSAASFIVFSAEL